MTTLSKLYNACGVGINFFSTSESYADIPEQTSGWKYATGILLKRTGGTASVILFPYNSNNIAVTSTVGSNGDEWRAWEIK